ncbi:MAG: PAS domain S-box protein [Phycisphaerales bacterium]|nr:MAG: PAS domain S-box protein [Phycisphaerales bacterium]
MGQTKYRILLIEDEELDQIAFERFVKGEKLPYDYKIVDSVCEAKKMLDCEQFDIIVADYSLEDGTALDILSSVEDIPIILTTGVADERVAIEAWKAGAYDYIAKDSDRNYLKAIPKAVENAIDRMKMEKALERKQKNLEAVFDAAPVGMLLADENMVITRVNRSVSRMLHKDYPQIIDRQIGDALGCTHGSRGRRGCRECLSRSACLLRQTMENVRDTRRPVHDVEICPTLEICNQETTLWLCISAEPVMVDDHKYVLLAVNDITERKRAQEERQLAEEKYRMIFENSAVAITLADDQERLISWNRFTEGLLGMEKEDLYLRPIKSLYPAQEWRKIRTCHVKQKGMQHHLETCMIRKDGSIIDVDISLSVFENSNGKTKGSIGVIRDITERKKAEEKLKETMELKSQFISTVSHELRTPLAAIKEGVAIVLDGVTGPINEKQKEFLDVAKRNTERLSVLIKDVLDFQKLRSGNTKPDIQSNDIEQVLSDVHETMALCAQKRGVKLSVDCAQEVPSAEFDRDMIIQVLTNLVGNAIKFTPAKGRVSVDVRHREGELVIGVSDTGMGIPKEALPKIFERFYRVKRPGKEIQGTGLGLAIVHKIVMMHGGRIEVESEIDQGTTFTVFLPVETKTLPEASSTQKDEFLESAIAE